MKNFLKYFIITLLFVFIIFNIYLYNLDNRNFNKDKWNNIPEKRYQLIDSLTYNYQLIGMSRKQVLELLGNKEILTNTSNMIEYLISSGIGDEVGFIIFFNEKNIVYDYKISPH